MPNGLMKRMVFVFLMWSASIPLLYTITCDFGHSAGGGHFQDSPPNTLGPFRMSHYVGTAKKHCDFSMALDQLSVSKGSAGLFKTALFQRIHITTLKLQSFGYSGKPSDAAQSFGTWPDGNHTIVTPAESMNPLAGGEFFNRAVLRPLAESDLKITLPDMSRAAEVAVTDFLWQCYMDLTLELSMQSHLAVYNMRAPGEVLLKGHVILQTPEQRIETNHAVLDLQTRQFQIPGAYVLTVNKEKIFGRNVCVDRCLKLIVPPETAPLKGENVCMVNPSH